MLSVFRIVVVVFYLMTTNRLAGFVDIVTVMFDFWLFGCDVLLATKSRRHDVVGAYSLHVTCHMRILQNLVENSEGCATSEAWGTWEECIMSARPYICTCFGTNSLYRGILRALIPNSQVTDCAVV